MKRRRRTNLGEAVTTVTDLKRRAKIGCASPFFDPATMRFFKSKVHDVFANRAQNATCFVTSEQGPFGGRRFSVREFKNCDIRTIGDHMKYGNRADARDAARACARKGA